MTARSEGRHLEMVAIKLYDLETGHVETLVQVPSAETARAWLDSFGSGGVGTNDVIYTTEVEEA
jgi:hypothetical protein